MDGIKDVEHVGTELKVDGSTPDNECPDVSEGFPASESGINGDKDFEFDLDGQILTCTSSHDSENESSDKRDHVAGSEMVLETHSTDLNSIENSESVTNSDAMKAPELEKPEAVWVKWRGTWQSGIRCARADWPLPTLRAKPTHDRKQYLVIFFPRTRNYSWADVLLVRPITEFPEPIAYKTHGVGAKTVRDLTLARRFIIQKLAVTMLNILDQLHREALIETARDVVVMKDFALEASCCKDYSDLGKILFKLQNMILQQYFAPQWLEQSVQTWKQRCHDADSAESVEILKEELADSILWNEVNVLSDKAMSTDLRSEWRSWKHDVMMLFSVSHPISNFSPEQSGNNSQSSTDVQMSASKRPKLEIRRADMHASSSHQSVPVQTIYSSIFNACDVQLRTSLDSETQKTGNPMLDNGSKWDNIVVEPGNSGAVQIGDAEPTPIFITQDQRSSRGLGSRNRQCVAFIESKGRQCVRFANEGDVYCCVHLATRYMGNAVKPEPPPHVDSPMCGGTTVLGTKCKHRALIGSLFCKKHMPQDGGKGNAITSANNNLKRKLEEPLSPSDYYMGAENEIIPRMDSLLQMGNVSKAQELESVAIANPQESQEGASNDETAQCIGSWPQGGEEPCKEITRRHSLYCDKHIPSWLKRARNGKTRIVSKDVFLLLLGDCHSREEKLQLHQACELFYRLFKSILSLRNPVSKESQFQWAIGEASKDVKVGEFLMKLVVNEKQRLEDLWSFEDIEKSQAFSPIEELAIVPVQTGDEADDGENVIKCKICSGKFVDHQTLGAHWTDSHKKEAQWLFRGYVCAICFDSFTNKKVLELHVQERHHSQFVEHCMLLQCISCNSNFGNPEELWSHVLSMHPSDLRQPNVSQDPVEGQLHVAEPGKTAPAESDSKLENQSSDNRRFICRFCGLKFDLLPDLGRHHQAAHMGQESTTKKKGIQLYPQKLKSGRLTHPRFKMGLNSVSYKKIKNRSMQNLKKRHQATNSLTPVDVVVKSSVPESAASLGRVAESQCSAIAKILSSEIKRTKPQPTNSEILSMATLTCCKTSLVASLQLKYGTLPERIYLRAAKLCCEHNVSVQWHRDGFICPRGCAQTVTQQVLSPIIRSPDYVLKARATASLQPMTCGDWTMDESHCVIDSRHFSMDLSGVVLCDDVSFGLESVPIACVVDENLLNAEGEDGPMADFSFPWESFTYVSKPLVDQPPSLESELQCACAQATCLPRTCDHVYLFDNDFEGAKDIYGEPMRGRFPYDERGRIILEEGYLVYECNQRCSCSKFCRNRVLQNGVKLKLEIFKTEKKGWAVRTREAILRGTFVCEYIGEIIDEKEANERRNNRHGEKGSHYFYEVDAHINDMSRLIEGQATYVIDATDYGNVSRYINHSCSPNLANHQVLVESMDSQLAHIGFYASRDITPGEELTYDFRYKLLPGEGCPCLCGASNCRGRLY